VKKFLIVGESGAIPGAFVAEDEKGALDVLARRCGYLSIAEKPATEVLEGRKGVTAP